MTPFRGSAGLTEKWEHFRFELEDGVATITFDRPEKLNALTFEVYGELRDTFRALADDASVRAVVITGAGRGFCSGEIGRAHV